MDELYKQKKCFWLLFLYILYYLILYYHTILFIVKIVGVTAASAEGKALMIVFQLEQVMLCIFSLEFKGLM